MTDELFDKLAGEEPVPPEELAAMKESADVYPLVLPLWHDKETAEDRWEKAEKEAERAVRRARDLCQFKVDLGPGVSCITFLSDQHIAPGTPVDMARMRHDAELIRDTPGVYACLAGDGVDNHIKIRSAMLAARSQPSDQYELYEHYMRIMANKILAVISGNHDAWTNTESGLDMVAWICERNGICFAPAEARMDVKVGGQDYKVAYRHQYRMNSTYNQTHAVKQWYRLGEDTFDVGCIGHHHEPAIESFMAHGQERWACRPGSYQITSAYTRQYGWNSTYPTCPSFVLWPDRRKILGFSELADAVVYMRGLGWA